ncbi:MAG: AMP-binding protein [Succinivibrio sp.]
MNIKSYTLHEAIYSDRSPSEIVAYHSGTPYRLYDLQVCIKSLSVLLQMGKAKQVAISVENALHLTVCLCAVLYARKIPVLLGKVNQARLDSVTDEFDAIFTDEPLSSERITVYSTMELFSSFRPFELSQIPKFNHDASITPVLNEDSKIIFYTSGSTGKSKRIEKTLRAVQNDVPHLEIFTREFEKYKNLVVAASVPPFHVYGMTFRIMMPLLSGIPFDSKFIRYHEELCDSFTDDKEVIFVSSPAFIKRIDTALKAPKVVFTLSAGSSLDVPSAKNYFSWSSCQVTEIYGSTETSFMAYRQISEDDSLYTPFEGVHFKTVNDKLYLFSPLLDKKYLIDDKLVFVGDRFRVEGRKDRIVKLEENRISLDMIEACVREYPNVKDCVALPVSRNGASRIGLVLCVDNELFETFTDESRSAYLRALKVALRSKMIPVAVPRYIRVVKEIPVNSMGKKVESELRELFND